MARDKDIRPIAGQHFNTNDPILASMRARLHACRRELGRIRNLPDDANHKERMTIILESRETLLLEQIDDYEEIGS